MDTDIWNVLMQISVVVAGLAAGGTFSVSAIGWLKRFFGTNGGWTMVIAAVFATAITLAVAVVEQTLAPNTITPTTWGTVVLAIIFQANTRYQQIKRDIEDWDKSQV